MSFYSVWPTFACIGILFGLSATPLLKVGDEPPSSTKNRLLALDGLRGFLALLVVFHHLAVYRGYLQTGVWADPPTHFYQALGPLAVSAFFMITGFLFWERLLRSQGRMQWRRFYTGRLFRISPMYLLAVLAMVGVVLVRQHFHMLVSRGALAEELGRWLSLGLLNGRSLDGTTYASTLLAGVTWTIQWEWFFYLSLPLLAFGARRRKRPIMFLLMGYALCLLCSRMHLPPFWPHRSERLISLFLMGMMAATLRERQIRPPLGQVALSVLTLTFFVAAARTSEPYSFKAGLLIGVAFYLITCGSTLFGLLVSLPARRLGDISYGIYLLQGLSLAMVLGPHRVRAYALASPVGFWICGLGVGVLLLLLAGVAHVLVERPGILLGQRVAAGRSLA